MPLLVTHRQVFETCRLFNILPLDKPRAWEPQYKLWQGSMILEEIMIQGCSTERFHKYKLKFMSYDGETVFCETKMISSMKDFKFIIQKYIESFRILVKTGSLQIALELRIEDKIQNRRFRDIWLRINDEYEILQEILDTENDKFGN